MFFYNKISQVQKSTKRIQGTKKYKNQFIIYQFKIHRHKIHQFKIHRHKIYKD